MEYVAWGKLIRKSLLIENTVLFPEHLTYEDTYWGFLLHMYTEKVYFLEETLYHYFVNENSTVLQMNSEHHLDLLTVQLMLWNHALPVQPQGVALLDIGVGFQRQKV